MLETGLRLPEGSLVPDRELLREAKAFYSRKGTEILLNYIGKIYGVEIDMNRPAELIFRTNYLRTFLDGDISLNSKPLPWDQSRLGRIRDGIMWAFYTYIVNVLGAQNISSFTDFFNALKLNHPAGTNIFTNYEINQTLPNFPDGQKIYYSTVWIDTTAVLESFPYDPPYQIDTSSSTSSLAEILYGYPTIGSIRVMSLFGNVQGQSSEDPQQVTLGGPLVSQFRDLKYVQTTSDFMNSPIGIYHKYRFGIDQALDQEFRDTEGTILENTTGWAVVWEDYQYVIKSASDPGVRTHLENYAQLRSYPFAALSQMTEDNLSLMRWEAKSFAPPVWYQYPIVSSSTLT
jgi:hypothetical protein